MITNILILSALIWGLACLFTEGMIFGWIGSRIENMDDRYKWLLKPIILCPPCMSSVWGSVAALYLGYDISHWLVLVFTTVGLNYIIANK